MDKVEENKTLALIEGNYKPFLRDKNGGVREIYEAIREATAELVKFHDKSKIILSELLSEIYNNKYYEKYGFKTFEEYVEEELDFQYRQAAYLVKNWDVLVKQRGISPELLRGKSWAKLKEIVIAAENAAISKGDIVALIEESDDLTIQEVAYKSKKAVLATASTSSGEDVEAVIRLSVNLFPKQHEIVQKALDEAKVVSGNDKTGVNLEYICVEFLASRASGSGKDFLVAFAKAFEGSSGKKIVIADDEDVIYASKGFLKE